MNTEVVATLAGAVGLVTGIAAGLAVRVSERANRVPDPSPATSSLPPGIASVLSVLPSSAVVIDGDDTVLRASSAARAYGIVSGDRLVVDELLALARVVRRDGEIRQAEIEVPSGGRGDHAGRAGRAGRAGQAGRGGRQEGTWFAVRVAPLVPRGLVLVLAEDLTEMRRVEMIRRDFVANVSHELKTPVGALSLLAETVEGAAEDPEAVRRFADRMQYESSRLTNLVQDLITLSRVQGGEPIAEPSPVALDDIVREAVDRSGFKASSRDIALVVAGDPGLRVAGDEELLTTALRNLVDNAVAYSPEHTRVVVCTEVRDGRAEIGVTDQGFGIPESELERIFERFYRVDPARSRRTGGTGLGLAIVKHVTQSHGGDVRVWSREDSGSTFTLRLPLLNEKDDDKESASAPPRQTAREATQ